MAQLEITPVTTLNTNELQNAARDLYAIGHDTANQEYLARRNLGRVAEQYGTHLVGAYNTLRLAQEAMGRGESLVYIYFDSESQRAIGAGTLTPGAELRLQITALPSAVSGGLRRLRNLKQDSEVPSARASAWLNPALFRGGQEIPRQGTGELTYAYHALAQVVNTPVWALEPTDGPEKGMLGVIMAAGYVFGGAGHFYGGPGSESWKLVPVSNLFVANDQPPSDRIQPAA